MSYRLRCWLVLGVALGSATWAGAEEKRLGLGVYLPATIDSRDKQAEFAQALAAQLTTQLGHPVVAYPFARYEDFAKAAADGTLDFAVCEAVVLAQARGDFAAIATLQLEGDPGSRWAIVAEQSSTIWKLAGKHLALVKGPGNTDAEFVSNVVFGGDLPRSHFQLVFVPSADSARGAIEAKKADAALVLAVHAPPGLKVLYRSGPVAGALLVNLRGNADLKGAIEKLSPIAPFSRFSLTNADDVSQLRRRIARPPSVRTPLVAQSPTYRPDPGLLQPFKAATAKFPTFVEFVEVSKEQPDD